GAARGGPAAGVDTITVKKIEDGVSFFSTWVVAGRRVDVVVAMIADDSGLIEVMMDFSVGDVVGFPSERRRTRNVEFAGAVQEIWLNAIVRGIEAGNAIHLERVTIEIWRQPIGGGAPNAF